MQGGVYAKGKIDDVRVWNRDLSNAQLQGLYSSFSAPSNPANDVTAPVISSPYPRGILPANSYYIVLSVKTDEVSTCKYDTNPSVAFGSMAGTFTTTMQVEHNTVIKGIANGQSYNYYVKCQDIFGNTSSDYDVSFSTAPPIPFQSLSPTHSGNYWFVSPTGSAGGDGSIGNPWDLQTALSQPSSVVAGDTVWMRGGIYGTGISSLFTSTLTGTLGNNIVIRSYPGERAIIDGNMNITGPYSTLWGIEFFNSNTVRLFNRFAAETGHLSVSPNVTLINLVVHDFADTAIGYQSNGGTIYGTIMWGNGGYDYGISGDIGSPTLTGSGMYLQNNTGNKYVTDNVTFKEYTTGFKAYTENGYANGFDIEGNVNFNNNLWNMFVSGIAHPINNLVIKNNYLYRDAYNNGGYGNGLELNHYGSDMIDATLQNNYIVGGGYNSPLVIHKWQTLNVTGNTVVSLPSWTGIGSQEAPVVKFDQAASVSGYTWDNNTYYSEPTSVQSVFTVDGVAQTLAQVRSNLGIDTNSTYTQTLPTQNVIVVRPNQYETGRGNIVVYNWQNSSNVSVDISSLGLTSGDYFEVYDVQNLFGQPVYSGVYNSGTISLPMNLTDTQPMLGTTVGMKLTHTDSLFNTFLVKKVPISSPIDSTQTASSTTSTGTVLNGSIDDINGSYVTSRGFAWGTNSSLSGGDTATTTESGTFSTSTFTKSLTGLSASTTYYYRAYAVNAAGTSTASILSVTTSPPAATNPDSPTSVSATPGNHQATVTFTAGSNGGSPILYYLASSTPGNITATSSGSSITVTGLTNGTTYTFQVYAVNAVGASTPSSASSAITLDGTAPTTAAHLPGGTYGTAQSVTLTCTDNVGGVGCNNTYYSVDGSAPTIPYSGAISISTNTNLKFYSTDLNGNTESTKTEIYVIDSTYPFTTITPSTVSATTSTGISFSFVANKAGSTYECKLDSASFASCSSPQSFSGLSDGSHTFTVRAIDTLSHVEPSPAFVTWLIDTTPPNAFTLSLPADNVSIDSSQPNLIWNASADSGSGLSKYQLFIDGSLDTDNIAANTTAATPSSALSRTAHTWYVKALDLLGNITTSNTFHFTINSLPTLPTLSVPTAGSISQTGATLTGSITNDGNASSTVEGFNYGTSQSYGSTASTNGTFGIGSFDQTISSLTCGTTYHFQSFATNSSGTQTSSDQTFTASACTVAPTPTPTPIVSGGSSSGGGGSASSQVNNLLAMGNYTLAQQIAKQYGLVIPQQNIPASVVPKSGQSFTRTLKLGMTGADVKQLQIFLNTQGFTVAKKGAGSPGHETTTFGPATKAALMKFQLAHKKEILDPQGLKSPTGVFAAGSMKVVNAIVK
jgi:hypothetical protein